MSIKTAQENAPAVQTENALLGMKAGRPLLDELPPKPCGGIFLARAGKPGLPGWVKDKLCRIQEIPSGKR
jgi:hypothetical protein